MKKNTILIPAVTVLLFLVIAFAGCKNVKSPTAPGSPAIAPTFNGTYTITPTKTAASGTFTMTATVTRTNTTGNTQTITPTLTQQVLTITITPTTTQIFTQTVTQTVSETSTQTTTPQDTQTVTQTGTLTNTQTITPTSTETATQTVTQTATLTSTVTPVPWTGLMPLGILAANSGIYLSTNGGSPSGLVEKFGTDGTYISTIGSIGSGVGQYKAPYGLASDSAGDIYVADFLNNRIVEFNKTGVFVQTIGSSGSGDGNLNGPNGVAVDSQNNIFVADSLNYRIEEFNLSGIFVRTIGSFGVQDRGICVDAADNVYVTTDGGTCYKYSNNGTLLGTFGTPGTGAGKLKMPVGIGVDPVTNDIFVADQYNNSIVRYNLSFGVKTTYMVYSAPFDLSLNGGTLWLANTDGAGFGQKDVISMIY